VQGGSEEGELMQLGQRGAGNERTVERDGDSAELARLRATCRRQAWTIETMSRVLSNLRRGVSALKAENAELRTSEGGVGKLVRSAAGVGSWHGSGESVQACVPLDVRAPRAGRTVVEQVLGERVAAVVLERAKLVMSELVSNSVRHGRGSVGAGIVVRVRLLDGGFWLEVEDRGRDGAVARHAANPAADGGFGLRIVDELSERWGIERVAQGGTRVWAQLSDAVRSPRPEFGEGGQAMQPRGERVAGPGPAEVHVIPEPRAATWGVYVAATPGALSEHSSETEAESAARAHLRGRDGGGIVVHDRYHRTHVRPLVPGK
jgi:anti-sigma regulatory factor (Ser/Thr protein kinase)